MKRFYIFLFSIVFVIPSFAQVTFIAPNKSVLKGDVFSAEIRVKTKDTISALQFTLEWNPSVIEFRSVDGVTLPVGSDDLFGLTATAQGNLKFLWLSTSADGFKVSDSLTIFKVNFKAIGEKGTTSSLQFTNKVIKVKALNPRVESLPVAVQDGTITISMTSATKDVNSGGAILYQNTPNPVQNWTSIGFELKAPDLVSFEIHDSIGRQVFQKKQNFSAGKHQIEMNTEGVLQKGLYVYSIRALNVYSTKMMVKL